MESSFRDPGGSFPPYNAYMHNSKRPRLSEDNNIISSSSAYLTFNVVENGKSLKDLSPFIINAALNQINDSWNYVSSNRDRDMITILVQEDGNIKKFLETKSFKIGNEEINVSFQRHPGLNFSKGTIFCPEILKMTDLEIVENLKDQNVHEVYRFKKRNSLKDLVDTGLFTITFQGNRTPQYIKIAYLNIQVSTYYPNPMQCNHCFKFGHILKKCKNISEKTACIKCGSNTDHEECDFSCVNCNEQHSNKYRGCAIFKKEKAIIKLKIDHNLSFAEARRRFNANRGASTFAEAADRGELAHTVETLNKKLELLIKENEMLKDHNSKYSERINELSDTSNNDSILQKQFDDFKRQMEFSSARLQEEMEKQKMLHQEQMEHIKNHSTQVSNELEKKNQLLEQIHKYLSDNNLYPENLKSKGIEVLLSSVNSHPLDKGLKASAIEIDDDEEDDTSQESKITKKSAKGPRSTSVESLKKLNVKQPKPTVKRLENKDVNKR